MTYSRINMKEERENNTQKEKESYFIGVSKIRIKEFEISLHFKIVFSYLVKELCY